MRNVPHVFFFFSFFQISQRGPHSSYLGVIGNTAEGLGGEGRGITVFTLAEEAICIHAKGLRLSTQKVCSRSSAQHQQPVGQESGLKGRARI